MIKHMSKRFGGFEYNENEVITFEKGLIGFDGFSRFVLRKSRSTEPLEWLLSVEDGGPELAVARPESLVSNYDIGSLPVKDAFFDGFGCKKEELRLYCVATVPKPIKHISINQRTPVFIDMKAKRGIQYPLPGIPRKPVRFPVYRELTGSRAEDKNGILVILRKLNETVYIGDDITVEVMELAGGGVRLGISAPRSMKVSRGETKVTPLDENVRANADIPMKELCALMRGRNTTV